MRKLIIAAILVLAGCAPDQQRAQNECLSLGLSPGTGAYAQCYQDTMQRYAVAWQQLGQGFGAQPQYRQTPQAYPSQVFCQPLLGGQMVCNAQ